jgi:hypothetical protein
VPERYKNDVELVKGYNLQREPKFLEMVKNTQKEFLLMNRTKGYISKKLQKSTKEIIKRKIEVRSIYELNENFKIKINNKYKNIGIPGLLNVCKEFERQGEKVRVLEKVPQIIAVMDRKIVFLVLYSETMPAAESTDLIIKNEEYASSMAEFFGKYWNEALTIKDAERRYKIRK